MILKLTAFLLSRPIDLQAAHALDQRRGFDAQQLGRPVLAIDLPVGSDQGRQHVLFLQGGEVGFCQNRSRWAGGGCGEALPLGRGAAVDPGEIEMQTAVR